MKILFLGIDALDSGLLDAFAPQLPNFARLRRQGKFLSVVSTFPPDSDTAWATISTGMNPAEHGIVKFVDPLEKSYRIMNKEDSNEILHGRTFWDILGTHGFKTCAVFPHLAYPIWDTNATMVCRGKVSAEVQATSPDILDSYPVQDLIAGVRGLPERSNAGMKSYYDRLSRLAKADADFALELMKKEDWDVFFVYWSTIDAIGHLFWNAFDTTDPYYDANNPFRDVIPETYRIYDQILGSFLNAVPEDVTVIVLSDHGHGARPYVAANVNEMLRQGGYLTTLDLQKNPHIWLFERTKRAAIRFVSKYGLARAAARVMRRFPNVVQTYTRPSLVDWGSTMAYATDMSGIKAYTYGGVVINRAALGERDYEQTRNGIIGLIREKSVLEDGHSILKFIAKREDVYQGPFLSKYPDIVLEFEYGYGVGWATNVPLVTKADTYNLIPGSHRGDTGVCMIRSLRKTTRGEIDLLDILPSLLDLMSITEPRKYDGRSIFG